MESQEMRVGLAHKVSIDQQQTAGFVGLSVHSFAQPLSVSPQKQEKDRQTGACVLTIRRGLHLST